MSYRGKLPRAQPLTGVGKPATITVIKNKASQQARLPSRAALRMLSHGDPAQRSIGNFAKLTPSGASAVDMPYSGIMQEGQQPEVVPALQDGTSE